MGQEVKGPGHVIIIARSKLDVRPGGGITLDLFDHVAFLVSQNVFEVIVELYVSSVLQLCRMLFAKKLKLKRY